MAWIKRNLYFVIGGAAALILMGLAGFYLYSKWQRNNEVMEKLEANFAELQRLNSENPHPGSGTVDNIAEARKQKTELKGFIDKLRKFYEPIPPIPHPPEFPKVSDREFSAALSRTIDQLQRAASSTSVELPSAYYSFSFEAQRPRVTFAPGSTPLLAVQLGDVKSIAEVLINAKVNSLDTIRRERVSTDDMTGPQTDYLEERSVTNELAVLTPYEVTFRCFSSELAAVLTGFASSPHAILVKSLNVEPAMGTNVFGDSGMTYPGAAPGGYPGAYPGAYTPPQTPAMAEEFARRYGAPEMGGGATANRYGTVGGGTLGGAGGMPSVGGNPGGVGVPLRGIGEPGVPAMPQPRQPAYQPGYYNPQAATVRPGALQTVLDEKQLKVTMRLVVVKLTPPTAGQ